MVTLADARRIADEIVSEIQPLSIVVFGSVARDGLGNDLDLLIVYTKDVLLMQDYCLGDPDKKDTVKVAAIAAKVVKKLRKI